MELKSFSKPIVKCTCGVLALSLVAMSIVEILDCPIHSKSPCASPHIETTFVSSGPVNPIGTLGTAGSVQL